MSGTGPAGGGSRPARGPAPHPAVAARRRTVAREQARRRRSGAVLLLGTAAAIALLYWLATGPLLAVHGVSLRGYDRPDAPELRAALERAGESGTVISPPVGRIRAAAASFPWVESLSVGRAWPRGLTVTIVQARPLAVAAAGDRAVVVAASGRVLEERQGNVGLGWIRLGEAPPAPGGRLAADQAALLGFLGAAEPAVAKRVRALQLGRDGMVTGRLDGGPELRLGSPERMEAKAVALGLVLKSLSPEEEAAADYITLVTPENPAVGGGATTTAEDGAATLDE
ncbi:cell division protein FtsQ/DivIB [Miltoncostaea marina]|uniref:cell division protein FtsQ/DivIB n=1 Tax=Miltoncostaea marina TaxID=2843215 RepID=UPI001C3CEF9E|nr:FtsQ-type POTRA domain-containing protein [Miltoncostaea marina]